MGFFRQRVMEFSSCMHKYAELFVSEVLSKNYVCAGDGVSIVETVTDGFVMT